MNEWYTLLCKFMKNIFLLPDWAMQSGQHYQLAMSSGLWLTLRELKQLRCIYGRKCAVLGIRWHYRCNRSERGRWFSASYWDQLWSSTITECVLGAFALPGELEVRKAWLASFGAYVLMMSWVHRYLLQWKWWVTYSIMV